MSNHTSSFNSHYFKKCIIIFFRIDPSFPLQNFIQSTNSASLILLFLLALLSLSFDDLIKLGKELGHFGILAQEVVGDESFHGKAMGVHVLLK